MLILTILKLNIRNSQELQNEKTDSVDQHLISIEPFFKFSLGSWFGWFPNVLITN